MTSTSTKPIVRFDECMAGSFTGRLDGLGTGWDLGDTERFERAAERGRDDGSELVLELCVRGDAERNASDLTAPFSLDGSVAWPAFGQPLGVDGGTLRLLVPTDEQPDVRVMRYSVDLVTPEGTGYRLEGFKRVHDDDGSDLIEDTTTLYTTLAEADGGRVVGAGVLRLTLSAFLEQLRTMRVDDARDWLEGLRYLMRFGELFGAGLHARYGGAPATRTDFNPEPRPRVRRPMRLPPPDERNLETPDGAHIRLTRYRRDDARFGPVVLTPGFGMNTLCYRLDTLEESLAEFLVARGYDVWLFDYRGSPALRAPTNAYTLDDLAQYDWPIAVAEVRRVSGAPDIQVLAHCVGSMTFLMAMLAGAVPKGSVRSAICSQLTIAAHTGRLNRFKAIGRVPMIFSALGLHHLETRVGARVGDVLADLAFRAFPRDRGERCAESSCDRIFGIYGPPYAHARLDGPTHAALPELFGRANVGALEHVGAIVRRGHIVDERGGDSYRQFPGDLARLAFPILFAAGTINKMFPSKNTDEAVAILEKHNGPDLYERCQLERYAHLDCFIGADAHLDVFPKLAAHLDRFPG